MSACMYAQSVCFLSLLRGDPTHRLSLTDSVFIATERRERDRVRGRGEDEEDGGREEERERQRERNDEMQTGEQAKNTAR